MKTKNRDGQGRRRDLLKLCAAALLASGAATALPPAARAQQPAKVPRVGWIWSGRSAGNPTEVAGFRQGLKELGHIEGQNIVVDYRFGEGNVDRAPDLAAELVHLRPDVLVVFGDLMVRDVKKLATTIPVVMLAGDPVGSGLVTSLARPGGNITGVSMMQGLEGLAGKRVELLKDALPNATRIRPFPVQRGDELEAAVSAVAREGVDGVDIEPVFLFTSYPRETGELLLKYRVPAVSELRRITETGGLLSYGPNLFDTTRRMAYFVDRILKGAKPADLPVEQASRLELVVNMKTAQALGLTIPPLILSRADEVIE